MDKLSKQLEKYDIKAMFHNIRGFTCFSNDHADIYSLSFLKKRLSYLTQMPLTFTLFSLYIYIYSFTSKAER